MRIAIIAPPWLPVPPNGYGGTELVLDTLSRGLVALGQKVLLCASGDSEAAVPVHWVHRTHLGTAGMNPADELLHVIDAYDAAARWGADVIHDHTVTGPVWAQAHATLPTVTTNHGPFSDPLLTIYRRVARVVPVIAISEHHASTAGDLPVHRVIRHGLDVAGVPVGDGRGGYALFLGRMNPAKGVHRAIGIARAAGIPLKIAAKMRESAERDYFHACVEPLLGAGVEYLGEVGPADKQELLGGAACLLNPIDWPEPFGMVMIEALAAGTPVLSTPCGAAPEIVEDGVTGFLRPDERALTAALADVGSIDRRACRAAAEQRFSMERMSRDHIAAYRAVVTTDRIEVGELARMLDERPPTHPERDAFDLSQRA